jgi:hypothetical protein
MKIEHNVTTGEIIEREFTTAELKQLEKDQADKAHKDAQEAAKVAAKQSVLDKLGLTTEEIAALLS